MAVALDYRERALRAEARVAELEEELAAWRAMKRDEARDADAVQRETRIREALRSATPEAGGPAKARVLLALIERPGEVVSLDRLLDALRGLPGTQPDVEPMPKIVAVHVCKVRKALKALGRPGAIETVWGRGFRISADDVRWVRAYLLDEVD